MLVALLAAVAAAVVARFRGGSLDALAATHFRWAPLLYAGLLIQVGFDLWDPPWLGERGGLAVLLLSSVLVAAFLAVNLSLPGIPLAILGMAANAVVIVANGAMPVARSAARIAGVEGRDLGIKHEIMSSDTLLPWLADVIPIPGLGALISVGDVVLAAGIAWLVYGRSMADEGRAKTRTASD